MPLESVRLVYDPVLRKPCEDAHPTIVSYASLLASMFETMKAENGRGLAANQIGHSVRIFILKDEESYKAYINPEILVQEDLVDFQGEACLSIPGISAVTKRYRKVILKWISTDGDIKIKPFHDIDAFAVQHEMDHLAGKLYIDQFGPVRQGLLLGKHKKYLKEIGRQRG